MSAQAKSKMPSKLEFPDTIEQLSPTKLPDMWKAFGVENSPSARPNFLETQYDRMSSRIAGWTGHEHAFDRHGKPFNREEWHSGIYWSLNYLNKELCLGMKRPMVDLLGLCYTTLQESSRYGGDPVIEPQKGENTAVHSLHTVLQAYYVFQSALDAKPELRNSIEFFRAFQMTCHIMLVHDLGEMLGEAGSLAQVASTGNWGVKDKTAYERMVFNYGVGLAIQLVVDKSGDDNGEKSIVDKRKAEREFFKKMDTIKRAMNVQNRGAEKTDADMASEVSAMMKGEVQLSARSRKLLQYLQDCWEWVEGPAHSRNPFIGYLAAICERTQGTRHLNRMLVKSHSLHIGQNGANKLLVTQTMTDSNRILTNADYSEGHLGFLCNSADMNSPFEEELAVQAVKRSYLTLIDYFRAGPPAFFLDTSFNETKLHKDGSAFDPDEVTQRLKEIGVAEEVAARESKYIGTRPESELGRDFSTATAMPVIGKTAVKSEDIIALYERAIAQKLLPGTTQGAKSERSVILVRDLPNALLGYNPKTVQYSDALKADIENFRAMLGPV